MKGKKTTGKRFSLVWLQKENEKKIMKSTLTASCSFESSLPYSSAIFSVSRLLFYRFLYTPYYFSFLLKREKKFLYSFFVCFPEVPYMSLTLARTHQKKKKKKTKNTIFSSNVNYPFHHHIKNAKIYKEFNVKHIRSTTYILRDQVSLC